MKRKRGLVGIVAIVVVIALVAGGIFYFTSVNVSSVGYKSNDNACGAAGLTGSGFLTLPGKSVHVSQDIMNPDPSYSCIIRSVNVTTAGFTISGANTPLTIPPYSTLALTFTVKTPGSPYAGVLTIDLE